MGVAVDESYFDVAAVVGLAGKIDDGVSMGLAPPGKMVSCLTVGR